MLRFSIRSALKKYNIKKGLEILDNPNHHKMMRKELIMNIFPFGDDGMDISMIIKLVNLLENLNLISNLYLNCILYSSKIELFNLKEKFKRFSANNAIEFARPRYLPALYRHVHFWKL